jgi:hypothetical protein
VKRRVVGFAALLGIAPSAVAQVATPGGNLSISGTVVGSNGAPLAYSTVSILETGVHRFANENGSFVLANLSPGAYHLQVKQLGFTARDTLIQVSASAPQQIRIALDPSPFKLATMTIRVSKACVPGDAARGGVDFETILAELRNNAERERLLVKSYPFEYRLARSFDTPTHLDAVKRGYDTTSYRSDGRPPYEPGRLVRQDLADDSSNTASLMIPVLEDIGDPAFLQSHCFRYKGLERDAGTATHRIDFFPVSSLKKPDIEGSVFLDTASFVVRRATFRMTRPEQFNLSLHDVQVTTNYREIFPGVTVIGDVLSVQMVRGPNVGSKTLRLTEKQRLLDYKFLGAKPGDATIRR